MLLSAVGRSIFDRQGREHVELLNCKRKESEEKKKKKKKE